jgi:hypothetical protein
MLTMFESSLKESSAEDGVLLGTLLQPTQQAPMNLLDLRMVH